MTTTYAKHFSTRVTPQSEPIPGKAMVENSAGGYVFAVDDFTRLNRFLVIGNDGGSFYASEKKLTVENAQCVIRCLDANPIRTIQTIVEISEVGRAPKNDPAIFALAIAAGHANSDTRAMANAAIPKVCRTGTHLFQFVEVVQNFRGWGAGLRKGIASWYDGQSADQLAYSVVKYQQRNGFSHRDVLRLIHPKTDDNARQSIYRWIVGGVDALGPREVKRGKGEKEVVKSYAPTCELPRIIAAFEEAKKADEKTVIKLIREVNLPRECVPTQYLNLPDVWEALLEKMPLMAMTRNLAKMTSIDLIKPMSNAVKIVVDRLGDRDYIRKSRLHPMSIIVAAKTYAQGHGDKGSLKWSPVSTVVDALEEAFYLAFDNVEVTNKRTLIAIDVSASMTWTKIAGMPLTPRDASAVLALVTARTEPNYEIMAFSHGLVSLGLTKKSRLQEAVERTQSAAAGGTDCSLPMTHALERGVDVDTFIVFTDSETWAGNIHPCQALTKYRQKTGIPARLIVVGMVSNGFSIADPNDPGMLDVVGMDTSTPAVMADFSAGKF